MNPDKSLLDAAGQRIEEIQRSAEFLEGALQFALSDIILGDGLDNEKDTTYANLGRIAASLTAIHELAEHTLASVNDLARSSLDITDHSTTCKPVDKSSISLDGAPLSTPESEPDNSLPESGVAKKSDSIETRIDHENSLSPIVDVNIDSAMQTRIFSDHLVDLYVGLMSDKGEHPTEDNLRAQIQKHSDIEAISSELEIALQDDEFIKTVETEFIWRQQNPKKREKEIPSDMLEHPYFKRIDAAISDILSEVEGTLMPVGFFYGKAAQGKNFSKEEKSKIKQIIRNHPRLEYIGDGDLVVGNKEAAHSRPSKDMSQLAADVLENLTVSGSISKTILFGAAKRLGVYINEKNGEWDKFILAIQNDERVTLEPDGGIYFRVDDNKPNAVRRKDPDGLTLADVYDNGTADPKQTTAMTQSEINRALKDARKTGNHRVERLRRERGQGGKRKRGKNFRRKGSKLRGKTHGKKKSLDELIAEMNAKDNVQ